MCFLPTSTQVYVLEVLQNFLQEGQPFTGYDIWKGCSDCDELKGTSVPGAGSGEVSAFVREQFNTGNMPGWASTQVTPRLGPVLYFKLSKNMLVSRIAEQIRVAMRESGALKE